jgi:hypothetical protein
MMRHRRGLRHGPASHAEATALRRSDPAQIEEDETSYEHAFVGDAGSPHALLQRALATRNFVSAIAAAHALPHLPLEDAAALVVRGADKDPVAFFPRAATCWAARYFTEVSGVDIDEAQLLVTALGGLRAADARASLLALVAISHRRRELEQLERVFRSALQSGGSHY